MTVRSVIGRLAQAHADGSLSKSEYLKERRALLQQWLNPGGTCVDSGSVSTGLISERSDSGVQSIANSAQRIGSSGGLMESLANSDSETAEQARHRAAERILRAARESGLDDLQHPDDTVFLSRGALGLESGKPAEREIRPRYQTWLWVVAVFSLLASGAIVAGVWGAKGSWLPDLIRSAFSAIT